MSITDFDGVLRFGSVFGGEERDSSAESHRQTSGGWVVCVDRAGWGCCGAYGGRPGERDSCGGLDGKIFGGGRLSIRRDERSGGPQTWRRSVDRAAAVAGSYGKAGAAGARVCEGAWAGGRVR